LSNPTLQVDPPLSASWPNHQKAKAGYPVTCIPGTSKVLRDNPAIRHPVQVHPGPLLLFQQHQSCCPWCDPLSLALCVVRIPIESLRRKCSSSKPDCSAPSTGIMPSPCQPHRCPVDLLCEICDCARAPVIQWSGAYCLWQGPEGSASA
jgi:hypothetical protein